MLLPVAYTNLCHNFLNVLKTFENVLCIIRLQYMFLPSRPTFFIGWLVGWSVGLGPKFLDNGSQPSLNGLPQNIHTNLVLGQALQEDAEGPRDAPQIRILHFKRLAIVELPSRTLTSEFHHNCRFGGLAARTLTCNSMVVSSNPT